MFFSQEHVMSGLISHWVRAFAQRLRELGRIEGISSTNVALGSIRTVSIALLNLLPATPAHPQDTQNRFVEFKDKSQTTTYDLRTVEVIQPGKFVIVETFLDHPDVMRFNLKVLDALRSHCARPAGTYPPPTEVFTLGPPDMPVKDIEVTIRRSTWPGTNDRVKTAFWWRPYIKTMVGEGAGISSYRCNQPFHSDEDEYFDDRNSILNGTKIKELFDCNRGLQGTYFDADEHDYRKILIHPIPKGTVGEAYYIGVCRAVTGKDPYLSE
jgi:hypothetical protein